MVERGRRSVLRVAAGVLGVGVAGCAGDGEDARRTDDGPASTTVSTAPDTGTTSPPTTDPTQTERSTATDPEGEYELRGPPSLSVPDATVDGVETYRGLTYATAPAGPLGVDLHLPVGDGRRPLLVHVHGGGWITGNRRWDREGRRHARLGIATATVGYRLSTTATYPAAVRDVVAAVTWLRREAADAAGIDPDRVVLIGESAGAHLAALVANAPRVGTFAPPGVEPFATGVDGVVGISGIYHLTGERVSDEPLTDQFFGCTGVECPGKYREGSPATHVDAESPPTLLYHGTADRIVPYRASTMYRDDLRAAGVPVTLVTGEGGGHVTPYEDPWGERMRAEQRAFLGRHLDVDVGVDARGG